MPRRLAAVRRLSAHRAVRARARLLQRRQREVRRCRRFRHGAGAIGLVRPLRGAPVRAGADARRRRHTGTRRRQRLRWPRACWRRLQATRPLPSTYYILEVSADLRARQQQRTGAPAERLPERVQWLDALPADADQRRDRWRTKSPTRCRSSASWSHGRCVCERGVALSLSGELMESDRAGRR